ncbi:hypothetical protein [Streptomyces sp. NPDC055287]
MTTRHHADSGAYGADVSVPGRSVTAMARQPALATLAAGGSGRPATARPAGRAPWAEATYVHALRRHGLCGFVPRERVLCGHAPYGHALYGRSPARRERASYGHEPCRAAPCGRVLRARAPLGRALTGRAPHDEAPLRCAPRPDAPSRRTRLDHVSPLRRTPHGQPAGGAHSAVTGTPGAPDPGRAMPSPPETQDFRTEEQQS